MTFIVTGGAGFIGANFLHYLIPKYPHDRVVCIDSLTYAGCLEHITPLMNHPNFRFIQADICCREHIDAVFAEEQPDIVINFAAESHVDRSIDCPDIFAKTNILGTMVLLDACVKIGKCRFHQVSTDEVYGDLPLDKPDLKFHESSPLAPSSPYSASKASADLMVLAYHRTYGLPVTISRCSNNYGPFQHPEKLIPLMITNALHDNSLPVYGTGENIRDWIYVQDHCEAIDLILHNGKIGEVYNIGGNCERSNISVVKAICRTLDKPEQLIRFVADRKGHDLRYAIDSSKIRSHLCWHPKTSFQSGLQKTIQWFLANYNVSVKSNSGLC